MPFANPKGLHYINNVVTVIAVICHVGNFFLYDTISDNENFQSLYTGVLSLISRSNNVFRHLSFIVILYFLKICWILHAVGFIIGV